MDNLADVLKSLNRFYEAKLLFIESLFSSKASLANHPKIGLSMNYISYYFRESKSTRQGR